MVLLLATSIFMNLLLLWIIFIFKRMLLKTVWFVCIYNCKWLCVLKVGGQRSSRFDWLKKGTLTTSWPMRRRSALPRTRIHSGLERTGLPNLLNPAGVSSISNPSPVSWMFAGIGGFPWLCVATLHVQTREKGMCCVWGVSFLWTLGLSFLRH